MSVTDLRNGRTRGCCTKTFDIIKETAVAEHLLWCSAAVVFYSATYFTSVLKVELA